MTCKLVNKSAGVKFNAHDVFLE